MYGGSCSSQYFVSMLDLQLELLRAKHQVIISTIQNESLITRARNYIASTFLESDCDYLLFIDADHGFVAQDVLKMIETELDILCAIPPKKVINWDSVKKSLDLKLDNQKYYTGDFVINAGKEDVEIQVDKPFEIVYGGTGMMLIKRAVFEKLAKVLPSYKPNNDINELNSGNKVTEFFTTEIHDEILLSEDYSFCKKWKGVGGKIYAAPWVRVSHVGTYEFSGSFIASVELSNLAS